VIRESSTLRPQPIPQAARRITGYHLDHCFPEGWIELKATYDRALGL
jgi:hypothetical protein